MRAAVLCIGVFLHSLSVGAPPADITRQVAKIQPGMTQARVKEALGVPWRAVQYNDLDDPQDEIWEYRGQDSAGPFRVHIEFDQSHRVHIIVKIREDMSGSDGTPATSSHR